jgi:hypothetical protein
MQSYFEGLISSVILTWQGLLKVLLESLWILLPTFIILELFNSGFDYLINNEADNTLNLLYRLTQMILQLTWTLVAVLVVPYYVKRLQTTSNDFDLKTSLGQHISSFWQPLCIESMRSVLKIVLWSLLLLLPGLWKSVKLYFVTLVVQLDQKYIDGKVDALDRSESLFKNQNLKVFLNLLPLWIISLIFSYITQQFQIWTTPVLFVGAVAMKFVVEILATMATVFLFLFYLRKLNEVEDRRDNGIKI